MIVFDGLELIGLAVMAVALVICGIALVPHSLRREEASAKAH